MEDKRGESTPQGQVGTYLSQRWYDNYGGPPSGPWWE